MEVTFYSCKQKESKIVAFADVMVAEGITVRGFRIVDGPTGLFAAVPSRGYLVDGKARFANQVTFADREVRERFLSELLERFYGWRQNQTATISPPEEDRSTVNEEAGAPF